MGGLSWQLARRAYRVAGPANSHFGQKWPACGCDARSPLAVRTVTLKPLGGTPEIVKDGETGFLVEKDNEKELYECIKQLDSDRFLLKQFSENGIRWVRSRFTNRRMVDDLEVIYHKLSP